MSEQGYIPDKASHAAAKADVEGAPVKPALDKEKEKTAREQQSQASPSNGVVVHQNWFYPTSKQAPGVFNVIFPKRSGNSIVFYKSSKDVFAALDSAIRNAKKSVDVISMGIDTDIRLTRDNEYRKVMRYSKVYPAEVDRQVAGLLAKRLNDRYYRAPASPDPHSSVFSDLITTRAVVEKAIVVRMVIGVPRHTIGNTFHDPLHLWWRCKTMPEYQGRIRFALREAEGAFVNPHTPPAEIPEASEISPTDTANLQLMNYVDFLARMATTFSDTVYQFIFTHHQKLYLIDIEEKDATGFVIGSNLNEDYWDDAAHEAHNLSRYPYRAWHDSGLEVKGPVLYDIAKSFEETWSLLKNQEKLPLYLYLQARNDQASGVQLGHNPSDKFKFPLSPPYKKETPSWGVKLPGSPEYYKPHSDANEKLVETQFTRTFSQEGAPKDFSTRKVIYRAVKQVRPGGVIYIENQYFRDLELMEHLKELGAQYSYLDFDDRPKIIILTNDPFLNEAESKAAAGPTFAAYRVLKKCGLPFHFCKLQTKEWPDYEYAGARY